MMNDCVISPQNIISQAMNRESFFAVALVVGTLAFCCLVIYILIFEKDKNTKEAY